MGGWVSILQWMFSLFFMFGIALDVTVILVAIKAQMREHAITVVLLLDLGCSRFKFTHGLIFLCTVFRIRILLFLSAANKFFLLFIQYKYLTFSSVFKDKKSLKRHKTVEIKVYLCLLMEGEGPIF